MTLLLVSPKLSFVDSSITVLESAGAVHFIRKPISIVLSTIGPRVLTFAVNVIIRELPRVTGPVLPLELSVTNFLAIHVLSFVASAV